MVHPISPDPFFEALAILDAGVFSLPAEYPRPEPLISPRSEAEMETWEAREALLRPKLDRSILAWLEKGAWSSDLDGEDGYLISVRMRYAREWLEIAPLLANSTVGTLALLEELLIQLWADCFLERHVGTLSYRSIQFQAGLDQREE